ncbi:ABC transporter permease [Tunicatimonas pelagia]|uniref:ABC transporter permease n=1 Tax=Tunicatimonas pelagia TaxID=931531 RepID=UPI0026667403|nr:ABC transporter permease [Tunicatimonas pelagia]WKN43664.1 ABC transporter permease [Tunicatimonas pelagia]
MLYNYFVTALRQFGKRKSFTFLNVLGLTIGLTASLLILLWVQHELSYDTQHSQADRIYNVSANFNTGEGVQTWSSSPGALAVAAQQNISDIEEVVRIRSSSEAELVKYQDQTFTGDKGAFVDPAFFTVFDFTLLQGDRQNMFSDPKSVVLTQTTAQKYFGDTDPMGEVIQTKDSNEYIVRGVLADFPANSSIQYDLLFPVEVLSQRYTANDYWKSLETDWGNFNYETYLLLPAHASVSEIEEQLSVLHRTSHPYYEENDQSFFYTTRPLADLHLYAADGSEAGIQEVRLFAIVALVILLIACINYVNLSTARATQRAKEISLRKLIGADRRQLFGQLLIESSLLFVVAAALALLLAYLLMPVYNTLSGKSLEFDVLSQPVLLTLTGTFLFTLLTAGIYPALLLSTFKPIESIRGKFSIGKSNVSFRKVLVVLQFSFSIVLIVGTLIISQQMRYVRDKKLGYDRENVFTFGMRAMYDHFDAVKAELEKEPGVLAVTSANQTLVNIGNTTGDTDWDGKSEDRMFLIHPIRIDKDFLEVMNMELVAGRGFTGSPADSAHYILNETAVAEAGIDDPVGKRFKLWQTEGTIIGIAKDFHLASVHQEIEPAIFHYGDKNWHLYLKTTGQQASQAITAAEAQWKQYNPEYPFDYKFLDERYDALYKSDQRTGKLFNYFTAIAILVSCLGLFGLATFTAEQRVKEIGIRKALGATVASIIVLLSRDFVKLVLLSILIATPIAWFVMNRWLEDFAYRTEVGMGVFLLAGCSALLIALLTISSQSIKAALANPVDSLRND